MHDNVQCLNLSAVVQCCLEATHFKKLNKYKINEMFIDIVMVSTND